MSFISTTDFLGISAFAHGLILDERLHLLCLGSSEEFAISWGKLGQRDLCILHLSHEVGHWGVDKHSPLSVGLRDVNVELDLEELLSDFHGMKKVELGFLRRLGL